MSICLSPSLNFTVTSKPYSPRIASFTSDSEEDWNETKASPVTRPSPLITNWIVSSVTGSPAI